MVNVIRADASIDQFYVRSLFRDSTSATLYRTIATINGSEFWATGSTSSTAFAGLHYFKYRADGSTLVSVINAGNQRWVPVCVLSDMFEVAC